MASKSGRNGWEKQGGKWVQGEARVPTRTEAAHEYGRQLSERWNVNPRPRDGVGRSQLRTQLPARSLLDDLLDEVDQETPTGASRSDESIPPAPPPPETIPPGWENRYSTSAGRHYFVSPDGGVHWHLPEGHATFTLPAATQMRPPGRSLTDLVEGVDDKLVTATIGLRKLDAIHHHLTDGHFTDPMAISHILKHALEDLQTAVDRMMLAVHVAATTPQGLGFDDPPSSTHRDLYQLISKSPDHHENVRSAEERRSYIESSVRQAVSNVIPQLHSPAHKDVAECLADHLLNLQGYQHFATQGIFYDPELHTDTYESEGDAKAFGWLHVLQKLTPQHLDIDCSPQEGYRWLHIDGSDRVQPFPASDHDMVKDCWPISAGYWVRVPEDPQQPMGGWYREHANVVLSTIISTVSVLRRKMFPFCLERLAGVRIRPTAPHVQSSAGLLDIVIDESERHRISLDV